jgi:hypothetical protein
LPTATRRKNLRHVTSDDGLDMLGDIDIVSLFTLVVGQRVVMAGYLRWATETRPLQDKYEIAKLKYSTC